MTAVVLDASVALKWFIPEVLSDQAEKLLDGSVELLAPDVLFPEFGNSLWKKIARGEIQPDEARSVVSALGRMPLGIFPSSGLIAAALEIAVAYRRTVYDGLYVALAVERDCVLVTADDRLVRALSGGPLAHHARGLSSHR